MTDQQALTDESFWDAYWSEHGVALPAVAQRSPQSLQVNAILDTLDRHLPEEPNAVALEIGGAPGQYLAYLNQRFGYRCAILDFSPVGCQLARRNFEMLGIQLDVYEGDLFASWLDIGPFDVVFSLGFVEHFESLTDVVAAHTRLVKPGGTLAVGAPNVRGVNGWFMRRLGPRRLASHNTDALLLDHWDAFEADLCLERVFRGYVGGFEPGVFAKIEERTLRRLPLLLAARVLEHSVGRVRALRRVNHSKLSGYLLGVWRVSPRS
jgi:SAM-dependent methyltransferase